jgi:hypothetical protein
MEKREVFPKGIAPRVSGREGAPGNAFLARFLESCAMLKTNGRLFWQIEIGD